MLRVKPSYGDISGEIFQIWNDFPIEMSQRGENSVRMEKAGAPWALLGGKGAGTNAGVTWVPPDVLMVFGQLGSIGFRQSFARAHPHPSLPEKRNS